MSDHSSDHTNTIVRERVETNEVKPGGGGTGMAFILGGVVVALLVIVWLFTGGDFGLSGGGATDSGDTNIRIDAPAPADPAPAPAPSESN